VTSLIYVSFKLTQGTTPILSMQDRLRTVSIPGPGRRSASSRACQACNVNKKPSEYPGEKEGYADDMLKAIQVDSFNGPETDYGLSGRRHRQHNKDPLKGLTHPGLAWGRWSILVCFGKQQNTPLAREP
jgi:hypothetical protein